MNYKTISITSWIILPGVTLIALAATGQEWLQPAWLYLCGILLGSWFPRPEVKRQLAIDIRKSIAEEGPVRKRAIKKGVYE